MLKSFLAIIIAIGWLSFLGFVLKKLARREDRKRGMYVETKGKNERP